MPNIAPKNIASVDLNLLLAFEAMLEERNVTRAGRRIGLAQPSMSAAVARLRALFDDELFQRNGGAMLPTPKALLLAEPVCEALRQVRLALMQGSGFDPATARHRFRLAMTDYGNLVLMPALVRALRQRAPGIDVEVRPIADQAQTAVQLEQGGIDAMVGGHLPLPRDGVRQRLFKERFVCLRDADQASAHAALDLAAYAALPHALFSASGGDGEPAALDALLLRHGLQRRVVAVIPHVMALPFVITGTDLVAAVSERVARRIAGLAGVATAPLPAEVPHFDVDLLYTRRNVATEAVRWLVALITEVSDHIDDA